MTLTEPDGNGTVLTLDDAYRYVHVYTSDTLPEPEGRRSVAVEPMTCPANALQSGDDVTRLEAGATTAARWWLRASGD